MKKGIALPSMVMFIMVFMSSCEVVGGIFKAGMWVGFIVVVLVIALVLWLINKIRK